MSKIAFTVIVPVYNVEKYLADCLRSVIESIPARYATEILCIDDGSTDTSAAILESFAERNEHLAIIRQANGGYGRAINVGLDRAAGRYVTIVEADDIVLPGYYDRILELLEALPNVDFVKTPYRPWMAGGVLDFTAVPPDGTTAGRLLEIIAQPQSRPSDVGARTFVDDRLCLAPPAIWSAVYRTASLRQRDISLLETPGASYQDTSFSLMCFLSGMKYLWINEPYYLYRVDREEASSRVRTIKDEMFALFDFAYAYLDERKYLNEVSKPYFYAIYFTRLVWLFERVLPGYERAAFAKAHANFAPVWQDEAMFYAAEALLSRRLKALFGPFRREDFHAFRRIFAPPVSSGPRSHKALRSFFAKFRAYPFTQPAARRRAKE